MFLYIHRMKNKNIPKIGKTTPLTKLEHRQISFLKNIYIHTEPDLILIGLSILYLYRTFFKNIKHEYHFGRIISKENLW